MGDTELMDLPSGLPEYLYFGKDWLSREKLYAMPPSEIRYGRGHDFCPHEQPYICLHRHSDDFGNWICRWPVPEFIKPYFIRNFVLQMSQQRVFPCEYFTEITGMNVYGTPLYRDTCIREDTCWCPLPGPGETIWPCHLVAGSIHMLESCLGWKVLAEICDSPPEKKLLLKYLLQNADRESPMLIPQVWMGEAEKFRVDFVAFLPTAAGYRRIAIECQSLEYHFGKNLDEAKKAVIRDAKRKRYLMQIGYEVIEFWADEINADGGSNCARELRAFMRLG